MNVGVRPDYSESDLARFEEALGRKVDFTLTHAWSRAAEAARYGKGVRALLVKDGEVAALAQGIVRRRLGFRKLAFGSNSGVGEAWIDDPSDATECLLSLVRRTRPSVLEAFASAEHRLPGVRWEPAYSFEVDLRPSGEAILSKMHKEARYASRHAERAGVKVTTLEDLDGAKRAYALIDSAAEVRGFAVPPRTWSLALHREFREAGRQAAILATLGGTVVSTATLLGYGGKVAWWKGGSTEEGYRLNAGNLVQVEAVRWAKNAGFELYDLGGTHPTDPEYSGIHRFKASLGGRLVETRIGRWESKVASRLRPQPRGTRSRPKR